jgi:hypothetical protein
VLGHIDEEHVVPELQFLEGLSGLVITAETMRRQRRFAAGSSMADGFRGLDAVRQRRSYLPSPLEKPGAIKRKVEPRDFPPLTERFFKN